MRQLEGKMAFGVFGLLRGVTARVKRSLELRKYNPSTIAHYLRRQGAQIGEGCYIVPTSIGTEPYLVKLGNHVGIAAGVSFITHDGGPFLFRDQVPDMQVFGPIVIEDNCVIGQNAILFPNVRVGPNAIVGAGSVVIADVPPNSIVMGVPARKIGDVEKYREKCTERWLEQRPPDAVIEPGATWWTSRNFSKNREALRRHLLALFSAELGSGPRE
jgi:acetyltransferase-like isoleucine patch superfamily enzyme